MYPTTPEKNITYVFHTSSNRRSQRFSDAHFRGIQKLFLNHWTNLKCRRPEYLNHNILSSVQTSTVRRALLSCNAVEDDLHIYNVLSSIHITLNGFMVDNGRYVSHSR